MSEAPMSLTRWRVAVVGPGGVGGLLGALLTRAGHSVWYVARPDTAAVLNAKGIDVSSAVFGQLHVPAPAAPDLAGPVDLCLVTVKAGSLDAALASVPADAVGDGLVLPLLNGVEHMGVLRARFRPERVVAGAIRVETTRVGPGRVEHTSPFCFVDVASATAPPDRVSVLADQLRGAGLDVTVGADEATLLWGKLVLLAPMALLTTHTRAPMGVVRDRRRSDLDAVAAEVATVARAAGARVDLDTVHAMFDRVPADFKSSMQRDAEAGRPTELDAIGGAVLRAAERLGVATPVTARLVAELAPAAGS
jgi:2-dehydropantoate 2-reductase